MRLTIEPRRLSDLIRLLGQLEQLHSELTVLVQAKIEAMKRADMKTLQEHSEREQQLVKRIQEREGLRRQLMDVIGEQLGFPPRSARLMTVSQLASRVPEDQGKAILESADGLRAAVSNVARVNRIAGIVATELMGHLRQVFAAVAPRDEKGAAYTGDGAMVARKEKRIFETIG